MQAFAHEPWRRFARPLAFALTLLSLFFLLQLIPHGHANRQDEATCGLCQAAHVGVRPAVSGSIAPSVPLVPLGEVTAPSAGAATESFFSHSPSRAPPSMAL